MNRDARTALRGAKKSVVTVLLTAGVMAAVAAPARLVGQPINNDRRIEAAFAKAVDCESRASEPLRYEGRLQGKPFIFLAMDCNFVGGNSQWTALMFGFHDGQRFTRVSTFSGVFSVRSDIAMRGDRLVYRAQIAKPTDARCCPSGKAVVEVDGERMVVTARPVGFSMRIDPVRGQPMR